MEDVKEYFYVLRSFPVRIGERASFRNVRSLSLSFPSLPRRYFLFCIFVFIGVAIDALINQSRMVSRVISLLSTIERTNERTKKGRSWRERELLVGRSDVPSDFCFASDKERHFNSLDHGDEHSRHTLSDAPLVSVPKKKLKGNYNQTVLRFAKSNVNEAVFVTCFRICFLCVFPFKGSFVSPVTHATNRIGTRNTHIRPLMYTRRSTRSRSLEIFARAEHETRIRT